MQMQLDNPILSIGQQGFESINDIIGVFSPNHN